MKAVVIPKERTHHRKHPVLTFAMSADEAVKISMDLGYLKNKHGEITEAGTEFMSLVKSYLLSTGKKEPQQSNDEVTHNHPKE